MTDAATSSATSVRLTQYGHGGGCACKIPPGELEQVVAGLPGLDAGQGLPLLVGLESGDDAAAVELRDGLAVLSTTDFFTPVVDDAYDWGRIAAANALSDIYAMGGRPVLALNLLGWPRDVLADGAGGARCCAAARTSPGWPGATSPAGTRSTPPSPPTGWR